MQITAAQYKDGFLMLKAPAADALKWLYSFKARDYDIVPHVEKRSGRANRYAWVLMGEIARRTGIPIDDVYRHSIENIGGVYEAITVRSNAVKDFAKHFTDHHIGRKVEIIESRDGLTDLMLTYGSSDFSRQQMAQLIDSIIEDCRVLGIETKDEAYINSLLESVES